MQKPIAFAVLAASASIAGFAAINTSPIVTTTAELEPAGETPVECVESHHVSALFAPGTDPAVVAMVSEAIKNFDQSRFQITGRWPGAGGSPVNLTYSFPSDGLSIPNGIGEGTNNNTLNATLNARFGSTALWKAKFAQTFQQWADLTGNTYTEVSDDDAPFFSSPGPLHGGSGRGDIRIAAKPMDGPSGVLAYNFFPGSTGGDMVLDNAEGWGSSFNDFRFFRNTIAHEHGHGLGILHVCPIQQIKLMEPFLTTAFDGPQFDDMRAAQFHYGDPNEPNNSAGAATSLGFFDADGSASSEDISIRNGSDDDYFSIEIDAASTIDVSATPFGPTYLNGPQNGNGSCSSGSNEVSISQIDLELTVFDTDGASVLATVNATNAGSAESLNDVSLPAAGTYFIRVQSDQVFTTGDTQMYDLDLSLTVDPVVGCVADINGDGVTDTADLGILIAAFGSSVTPGTGADFNGDGVVDTADLGILIGVFGGCTPL